MTIGDGAFSYCKSLESLDLTGSKITTIDNFVFIFCEDLKSVFIPSSVTYIGYAPFAYCKDIIVMTAPQGLPLDLTDAEVETLMLFDGTPWITAVDNGDGTITFTLGGEYEMAVVGCEVGGDIPVSGAGSTWTFEKTTEDTYTIVAAGLMEPGQPGEPGESGAGNEGYWLVLLALWPFVLLLMMLIYKRKGEQ
jgi:hypothetical protein